MPATTATRLSAWLRPLDAGANAITDAMNARVGWLWWPLGVPAADAPLPGAAHGLYAVHGLAIVAALRRAGVPLGAGRAAVLGGVSWLWFTGAWDRRALARASCRSSAA